MAQSNDSPLLSLLQGGADKIQEEVFALERQREDLYKDVNMKKTLTHLRKEEKDLIETKVKLNEEIQKIITEKVEIINIKVAEETEALLKTKIILLETISKKKKIQALLESDKDKLEMDIKALDNKYKTLCTQISEEKVKLTIFSAGVKKKAIDITSELEARETTLIGREKKVEFEISFLVSREDKVKAEEAANEELIKGLLKDLEHRELEVRNNFYQVEKDKIKNDDSTNRKKAELNKKAQELSKETERVDDINATLINREKILENDVIRILQREKDLETNWKVYVDEQRKFKEERRKFLSR